MADSGADSMASITLDNNEALCDDEPMAWRGGLTNKYTTLLELTQFIPYQETVFQFLFCLFKISNFQPGHPPGSPHTESIKVTFSRYFHC